MHHRAHDSAIDVHRFADARARDRCAYAIIAA
jgi:hypothetical protein